MGERKMNERIKELAHEVFSFKYKTSPYELNPSHRMDHLHKFAELIVQECIQQLETGKKCDPYTGELFTCEHNDNIDYQIKVLKEHFEVRFPEKFQTGYKRAVEDAVNLLMVQHEAAKSSHNYWHVAANLIKAELVHDSDTSQERVDEIGKRKHG